VSEGAGRRIGGLIAVSVSELAVVRHKAESRNPKLVGHHGTLTNAELLVPLLSFDFSNRIWRLYPSAEK
jgi:hypothetical protein